MGRRRSKTTGGGAPLLLIDAGLAAGWRRVTPDLDQLDAVIEVASGLVADPVVMADAALKWSLPEKQQKRFEELRATAKVLCAPGGTRGGHHAFLAAAARLGADKGRRVHVLTGLALGDGPWTLARLTRTRSGEWQIELPD